MNKDNKHMELVPEFRFVEFKKKWNIDFLENLSYKISDGIHSTPRYDDEGEYYFINGNNLINGKIIINENTKKVSKEEFEKHKRELGSNTILLSINGTIGNLSEYKSEKVVLGKSACYININEEKVYKKFIYFILKTERTRNYFHSELTGSTINNLSLKTIKNTVIPLPNPKEQQKIANTLSSLDEYIKAETEKVNLLIDHKKGLLQQLFPKEGETVPKKRFPEFVKDGDWEEIELGDCLDGKSSQIAKNKLNLIKNGYPVYGADGMLGYIDSYFQEKDYIAIVKDGSGVGNLFFYKGQSSVLGTLNYLLSKNLEMYNLKWLYYLLHTISFKPFVKGSGIPHIYYKDYSKLFILLPPTPKEQKKIAQTLTSVDDLIEAQTNKIDNLQAHKKGLMQGLFPNIT